MADLNDERVEEAVSQCINCKEFSHELLTCKSCSDQYHYKWVESEETEFKDIPKEIRLSWLCPECNPQDGNDDPNESQAPTNDEQESIMNEKISSTKKECNSIDAQFDACMRVKDDLKAVFDDLKLEHIKFAVHFTNKIKELRNEMASQLDLEKALLLQNKCEQLERDVFKKQKALRKSCLESEKVLSHLEEVRESLLQIELN